MSLKSSYLWSDFVAMNIAVATRVMGWRKGSRPGDAPWIDKDGKSQFSVPDFCGDPRRTIEMEARIEKKNLSLGYAFYLTQVVVGVAHEGTMTLGYAEILKIATASPVQRCEAAVLLYEKQSNEKICQ